MLLALFLIVGLTLLSSYFLFDLLASFKGAPFVPTSNKIVQEILDKAKLKAKQRFLELGSGDGRVVEFAVKRYGVKGTGIELNPLLVFFARLKKGKAKFIRKNFFEINFQDYDVIFMFLMPKTVERLKGKFKKEFKGKLIISHGFKLKGWEKYLVDQIPRKTFSTYYYKL